LVLGEASLSGLALLSSWIASAARPLAVAAVAGALLLPATAEAAIFASAPAANSATLTFKSGAGTLTGRWTYRSIAISGDSKVPLSKMALGTREFDLVEQGGKLTGTRPAGKGKTYDVTGFVVYGARRAPQVVLHSTSVVNGKSYEYDYFGYLMPSWSVNATQPDTFMGTVVVSFIATRQAAAAPAASTKGGKAESLPADSATPATR